MPRRVESLSEVAGRMVLAEEHQKAEALFVPVFGLGLGGLDLSRG